MNVASATVPFVAHSEADASLQRGKVSIRDLNFYYGDTRALKNISLSLYQNKVTAFIGPSGCGKSTLLRVLNRMYDLYPNQRADGEVLFDGENILSPKQDLNLLRARIGMVFQKPTPFPMSIFENIAFGIRLYEKLSKSELEGRVQEVWEALRTYYDEPAIVEIGWTVASFVMFGKLIHAFEVPYGESGAFRNPPSEPVST